MSHPITLLKQDHLIIKGRHYVVPDEVKYECIELDFTIQVNGKMANFQNSFVITDTEYEYNLENYGEWYLIVRMFIALGYYLSDECKHEHQI